MEINEKVTSSLLSDDDIILDEDVVSEEIVEDDPLGLGEIVQKEPDTTEEDDDDHDHDDTEEDTEEVTDFVSAYLKDLGIADPSKMQFQNEDGSVEEVDFATLSDEEKLNVLKDLSNPGYTEYEKNVIEFLRQNNATLDDVIEHYSQKAIQDYLAENPEAEHKRVYSIDDYTDDEIYLIGLHNQYPDFTDEELNSKLESAKLNDELFAKEVGAMRTAMKADEDAEIARQEQEYEQSYQELQQNLQNAMTNFTEIVLDPDDPKSDALQIEDADKQDMLKYLIERDKDGKSQLVKDLENPNALIEIAYYRTRERDNLTGLTRYWKNELANERKEKAKLQKELDKIKNKGKNSSVVTPPDPKPQRTNSTKMSIMDIYG